MLVERAAAPDTVTGPIHGPTGRLQHVLHGVVHLRLPGVHHAPGEEQQVGVGHRRPSSATTQWEPGREQPRPPEHPEALYHGEEAAPPPEQARSAQEPEAQSEPPRSGPLLDHGGAGHRDEFAEGHARRTGRLAAKALHAGGHGVQPLCVHRSTFQLRCAHEGNAATRRPALVAGDPVGRTVGKAQAALHAGRQGVTPQAEWAGRGHATAP